MGNEAASLYSGVKNPLAMTDEWRVPDVD